MIRKQVEKSGHGCLRSSSISFMVIFAYSQYHERCIPVEPGRPVAQPDQPPPTQGEIRRMDVITQDKIWKESVANEEKGLKQWEDQWTFLTEFDPKVRRRMLMNRLSDESVCGSCSNPRFRCCTREHFLTQFFIDRVIRYRRKSYLTRPIASQLVLSQTPTPEHTGLDCTQPMQPLC